MEHRFAIEITYFKPSGKFYTRERFERVFRNVGSVDQPSCHMEHVASYIRGLRDNGGQSALPGLSGDGWDGPIMVDCEQGFPVLIFPKHTAG